MTDSALLKTYGVRVTRPRLAVLGVLRTESLPRSVEYLKGRCPKDVSKVTVYRVLESLVGAGIARGINLGHPHALYELIPGRPHHHHAVCTSCGLIEDVVVPHPKRPEALALKATREFSCIDAYSFEFFGRCKVCA